MIVLKTQLPGDNEFRGYSVCRTVPAHSFEVLHLGTVAIPSETELFSKSPPAFDIGKLFQLFKTSSTVSF